MPGSSLWLTPPPSHPLHAIFTTLITRTLPALLPGDTLPFAPHLTLTSNINPATYSAAGAQEWLDKLPFPAGAEVKVVFERVKTEDVFFRRCYLKAGFEGVRAVGGVARGWGVEGEEMGVGEIGDKTERWLSEWKAGFGPHVSLVYGDMEIDETLLREVEAAVREVGITLALDGAGGGAPAGFGGWVGGTVWLVPTDARVEDWQPIATRTL